MPDEYSRVDVFKADADGWNTYSPLGPLPPRDPEENTGECFFMAFGGAPYDELFEAWHRRGVAGLQGVAKRHGMTVLYPAPKEEPLLTVMGLD